MHENNLDSFGVLINEVIQSVNQNNIDKRLILIDSISNITDGVFTEVFETIIDTLQKDYLYPLFKYLAHGKHAAFENLYVDYMTNILTVPNNRQAEVMRFDSTINNILPLLNKKGKRYALKIKSEIIQQADSIFQNSYHSTETITPRYVLVKNISCLSLKDSSKISPDKILIITGKDSIILLKDSRTSNIKFKITPQTTMSFIFKNDNVIVRDLYSYFTVDKPYDIALNMTHNHKFE